MTGTATSFQQAQAGQPGETAAETAQQTATTQAQAGNEQPQYVTKSELDAALAEVRKLAQSMTGKAEARINKQLAALQKHGIQATPQQVEALLADAEQEAQQSQPAPSKAQPAQAQAVEDAPNPASVIAGKRLVKAGIDLTTVNQNDPDFHLINTGTTDDDEYLDSINDYIKARKAREQSSGSPAKLPALAGGGAVTGGSKRALTDELTKLLTDKPHLHAKRIRELREMISKIK